MSGQLQNTAGAQQSSLRPASTGSIIVNTDDLEGPAIESGNQVCYFCRNNVAFYTCPRCHVHYCSVSCYKSPSHGTCLDDSDNAGQAQVAIDGVNDENEIEVGSGSDEVEDNQSDGNPVLDDKELEILVENASEEELWNMLTLEERRGFFEYYKAQGGT